MAGDSVEPDSPPPRMRRSRLPQWAVVAVVTALLAGAVAFYIVQGRSECDTVGQFTVAVDPTFAPAMEEALGRSDIPCSEFEVEAVDSGDVRASLGKGDAPDLWIPAGGWWAQYAQSTASGPIRTVSFPLATTPVAVAVAPAAVTEAGEPLRDEIAGSGWRTVLATPGLLFGNPLRTGPASGAIRAVLAEAAGDPVVMGSVRPLLAPLAQFESGNDEEPPTGQELIDAVLDSGTLGVTTEQQMQTYAGDDTGRADMVIPASGSVLVDYPLVVTSREVSRHDEVNRAATILVDALHTHEALDVLVRRGFRDGAGRPLPDGRGLGEIPVLGLSDENVVQEALDAWSLMALPVRTIFAVDVSSSMDRRLGVESRIELVRTAAIAANERLPGSVSAGLWFFGNNVDGNGSPYVQAAPMRRFDAVVDGRTHREEMTLLVERMTESATEGTALYATVLDAFRAVQNSFDPRAANSVVVVTDGVDSVGRITKDELLDALTAANDPARPVRIVTIGLGDDVDAETLAEISAVTGGSSYLTSNPLDITGLVVTAIADRTRR